MGKATSHVIGLALTAAFAVVPVTMASAQTVGQASAQASEAQKAASSASAKAAAANRQAAAANAKADAAKAAAAKKAAALKARQEAAAQAKADAAAKKSAAAAAKQDAAAKTKAAAAAEKKAASFAAPIPNYLHGRWDHPPIDHIPHLYYCDPLEGKDLLGRPIRPSFWIDITKQLAEKERMLACHASQRNWLIKHHGVDDYLRAMREWAAAQGKAAGVPAAEGFRQHLGHSYPQENLLARALGGIPAT